MGQNQISSPQETVIVSVIQDGRSLFFCQKKRLMPRLNLHIVSATSSLTQRHGRAGGVGTGQRTKLINTTSGSLEP